MTEADNTPDPYPDKLMLDNLSPGTLQRIDALLRPGETRQDYMRKAAAEKLRDDEIEMQKRESRKILLARGL